VPRLSRRRGPGDLIVPGAILVNRAPLFRVLFAMNTDQDTGGSTSPDPQSPVEPAAMPDHGTQPALSPLTRNLLFGLSLPERIVRSTVGLTAGTVKELAGFVVPQAFQTSKSYEIAITNSLTFLTETVGGAEANKGTAAVDEAGEFVARKAVGNFIDLAGLATLHVSPMWVLAVVSDVCYGTKTYTQEVARELQAQGVIGDTSTIHHVEDILNAIQRASGSAAGAFDRPPLSVDQLRQTISETRAALSDADVRKLIPQSELAGYWSEMQQVAREENVSLLKVSSAVTLNTLGRVMTVSQGALTGVRVAGGLLQRNVLHHYRDSLSRIHNRGLFQTVRESYRPYVDAVWRNFSTERKSWTESLLAPGAIGRGVSKLWGLFDGGDGDASRVPPPE
jgi:hypothetical protein